MWLFLLACSQPACPPGSTTDACLLEKAPQAGSEEIEALVQQIDDPIMRSAAVEAWVGANASRDPATCARLCDQMTGPGQEQCKRRAAAPHLKQHR